MECLRIRARFQDDGLPPAPATPDPEDPLIDCTEDPDRGKTHRSRYDSSTIPRSALVFRPRPGPEDPRPPPTPQLPFRTSSKLRGSRPVSPGGSSPPASGFIPGRWRSGRGARLDRSRASGSSWRRFSGCPADQSRGGVGPARFSRGRRGGTCRLPAEFWGRSRNARTGQRRGDR